MISKNMFSFLYLKSNKVLTGLLESLFSGTEPGWSTSTLSEAMALSVSASSLSDWPGATGDPARSEGPLV